MLALAQAEKEHTRLLMAGMGSFLEPLASTRQDVAPMTIPLFWPTAGSTPAPWPTTWRACWKRRATAAGERACW